MAGGKSFDLAAIIPEALSYQDNALGGDGQSYEVLTRMLLSTESSIRVARAEQELMGILLKRGEMEKGEAERAEQLSEQVIAALIPGLPVERRRAIPLAARMEILNWWGREQSRKGPASPNRR